MCFNIISNCGSATKNNILIFEIFIGHQKKDITLEQNMQVTFNYIIKFLYFIKCYDDFIGLIVSIIKFIDFDYFEVI